MFLKISLNLQKISILESLCNKVTEPLPESLFKKDPGTDVFLWFLRNISKHPLCRTPPGDYVRFLQVVTLTACQNDISRGNNSQIVTLMQTLNVFFSFAITLEAAIQNNLTKSWRFSREKSVVEFRYSTKLYYSSMVIVRPSFLGFTVILLMTEAVVPRCFSK